MHCTPPTSSSPTTIKQHSLEWNGKEEETQQRENPNDSSRSSQTSEHILNPRLNAPKNRAFQTCVL